MRAFKYTYSGLVFFMLLVFSCGGDVQKQAPKVTAEPGFYNLEPTEFLSTYYNTEGAVMIDVRTEDEYKAGALVQEALHIDYHGADFLQDMVVLDVNAPTFVYCYSGGRSSKSIHKMKQLGFKHIYELTGGYDKWQREQKK